MPDGAGLFGFGPVRRAVSPYAERADPIDNAVDRILDRWTGWSLARLPRHRWRLAREAWCIAALEPRHAGCRISGLTALAHGLARQPLRLGGTAARAPLMAVLAELIHRTPGKRPYPVQLMGALGLREGRLVKMATGEGKTLTAMQAAAADLRGEPVHVVTVNDDLAARDAEEIIPFARALGLSVAVVETDMDPAARSAACAADLTYASDANVAFDHLRDHVALGLREGRPAPACAGWWAAAPGPG